ncbi:Putative transposase (identified by ISEscan HMM) [Klebsiella pneumoniae]|nr:Putative transposase (identified by ISEscan HMM) [Klebsiella pneumoniae]
MAGSLANPMNFSWRVIFILMKRIKNLSEKPGDHNRLGIALQIGCVRFLGTFTDMNHIPSGVRHFTARQLGIRDITVLAEYGQRENTRREHAALIRQHYQYREFAARTFRLTVFYTRSWISNERPGLFSTATGVAYATSYYSPGATTLTRLISEVRESDVAPVEQTGTDTVSRTAFTAGDAGANDCSRLSLLESLKKAL